MAVVDAAPLLRVWGGPGIKQTRHGNAMVPLGFDSELTIEELGQTSRIKGRGVAELVMHPELAATLGRIAGSTTA